MSPLAIKVGVGALVALALAGGAARGAFGQDYPYGADKMEYDGLACPTVTLTNSPTGQSGIHKWVFMHPRGQIVLHHLVTPNGDPTQYRNCCDDFLTAVSWPEGLLPSDEEISVAEGQTGQIHFMCWEGM